MKETDDNLTTGTGLPENAFRELASTLSIYLKMEN